jgi:hypothetical protein
MVSARHIVISVSSMILPFRLGPDVETGWGGLEVCEPGAFTAETAGVAEREEFSGYEKEPRSQCVRPGSG